MKCNICGELHSLNKGKIIQGSGHTYFVCDDCAEENYYQCMECGEWYSGNRIISDSEGQHLCEDCYCDDYYDSEYHGEYIEYKDNIDYYKDYEELNATF